MDSPNPRADKESKARVPQAKTNGPPAGFWLTAALVLGTALAGSLVVFWIGDDPRNVAEWTQEFCSNLTRAELSQALDELADSSLGVEAVTAGRIEVPRGTDPATVRAEVAAALTKARKVANLTRAAWVLSGRLEPDAAHSGFVKVDEGFEDLLADINEAAAELERMGGVSSDDVAAVEAINRAIADVSLFGYNPAENDWTEDEQVLFDQIDQSVAGNSTCDTYFARVQELEG